MLVVDDHVRQALGAGGGYKGHVALVQELRPQHPHQAGHGAGAQHDDRQHQVAGDVHHALPAAQLVVVGRGQPADGEQFVKQVIRTEIVGQGGGVEQQQREEERGDGHAHVGHEAEDLVARRVRVGGRIDADRQCQHPGEQNGEDVKQDGVFQERPHGGPHRLAVFDGPAEVGRAEAEAAAGPDEANFVHPQGTRRVAAETNGSHAGGIDAGGLQVRERHVDGPGGVGGQADERLVGAVRGIWQADADGHGPRWRRQHRELDAVATAGVEQAVGKPVAQQRLSFTGVERVAGGGQGCVAGEPDDLYLRRHAAVLL